MSDHCDKCGGLHPELDRLRDGFQLNETNLHLAREQLGRCDQIAARKRQEADDEAARRRRQDEDDENARIVQSTMQTVQAFDTALSIDTSMPSIDTGSFSGGGGDFGGGGSSGSW